MKWLEEGTPSREYYNSDVIAFKELKRKYHTYDGAGNIRFAPVVVNKEKTHSLWYYLLARMACNYHICKATDLPMLAPPGNY